MISFVPQCRFYPGRCAVLPQLGGRHPEGYIDTGNTLTGGDHVYVSVYAVRHLAEQLGYRRPGDESQVKAENARLREENERLKAELEENEGVVDAARVLREVVEAS